MNFGIFYVLVVPYIYIYIYQLDILHHELAMSTQRAYEIELRKKKKLPLVSTCSPLQPQGWLQMAISV